MNLSIKTGFNFGLTSAIITTIGLMVGLASGTSSKLVVIGGILTIAIADAFSDALGIHISEESRNSDEKTVWTATLVTFVTKFVFASIFIIPVIFLNLLNAVVVSIIFGLVVLSILSYVIAKKRKSNPYKVILEHLLIVVVVIVITYFVGQFVNRYFNGY